MHIVLTSCKQIAKRKLEGRTRSRGNGGWNTDGYRLDFIALARILYLGCSIKVLVGLLFKCRV